MSDEQRLHALQTAVKRIPEDFFSAFQGGYPDEIGTALVNAVFSMRARFNARNADKGVRGRQNRFRTEIPKAKNDLKYLSTVEEQVLLNIMGRSVTAGRSKASAVVEVAGAFVQAGIRTSEEFRARPASQMKDTERIYTGVRGLGPITFEYFAMLLGTPGVKADTMITRFVNAALAENQLGIVAPMEARELVIMTYNTDTTIAPSLIHFDHALWKAQSSSALIRDSSELAAL